MTAELAGQWKNTVQLGNKVNCDGAGHTALSSALCSQASKCTYNTHAHTTTTKRLLTVDFEVTLCHIASLRPVCPSLRNKEKQRGAGGRKEGKRRRERGERWEENQGRKGKGRKIEHIQKKTLGSG